MSFAELHTAVKELCPMQHCCVGVEVAFGGFGGPLPAYHWKIYVDGLGYGPDCATPAEALEELRKRLGGATTQCVDPISRPSELVVPNVPPTQPNAALEVGPALAVGDIVSIDDTESLFCGQEAEVVHVGETAAAVEINGTHYGYLFAKLHLVRRAAKPQETGPAPNPGERFGEIFF